MKLLDGILGAKCSDCGSRIQGVKFGLEASFPGMEEEWVCSSCFTRREEEKRSSFNTEEVRRRASDEKWRQEPDRQVATELPRILDSIRLNPDDSVIAELKHFCEHVEHYWRGEDMDWITKVTGEHLLIGALSSPSPQVRNFVSRLLGATGFVHSVAPLIALAGAQDDSSATARGALVTLHEHLNRGRSTCPRCGFDSEEDGTMRFWRCGRCSLEHHPNASHKPGSFKSNRTFRRIPWDRAPVIELLEEVIVAAAGASPEKVREWGKRAEQIAVQRDQLVARLGKF